MLIDGGAGEAEAVADAKSGIAQDEKFKTVEGIVDFVDRGIWITWYDLPVEGRDEYFSWLHGTYIPAVLQRPGVLWAAHYGCEADPPYSGRKGRLTRTSDESVPAGTGFILLFGGREPHVFVNPTPREFHASLRDQDRRMLSTRSGERVNVMTEQARALGPQARRPEPGIALSPCIQLGSFNSASYRDEDELAAWYGRWYLPATEHLPGCVRTRKLVSVSGWAKHAILFEFTSLEARNRYFVNHDKSNPEMQAWTDRVVRKLIHAPGSPSVARRLWPAAET